LGRLRCVRAVDAFARRAGNSGSMEKCRRRWDLADAPALKYKFMVAFDRAMNHLDKAFSFSSARHQYISRKARPAGPYSAGRLYSLGLGLG
jgi:hypothetical protein